MECVPHSGGRSDILVPLLASASPNSFALLSTEELDDAAEHNMTDSDGSSDTVTTVTEPYLSGVESPTRADTVAATTNVFYDDRIFDCCTLPAPWDVQAGGTAARLWVRGDGTCASGALNLALLGMPGCIGDTMEKCRTADAVQQFNYQVVQLVQTWSDDQWCARVDKQLRDEMWKVHQSELRLPGLRSLPPLSHQVQS